MKIPFKLLPAAWGLKGKSREIAEAEYYYTGEELDRKLADINNSEGQQRDLAHLALDLKYGKIDLLDHDEKYIELTASPESKAYKLEMARIAHARGKTTDNEYEKEVATINEKGWVNTKVDSENYAFEFDWNEYFIAELEEAGFGPAPKEEQIVEEWFNALCKDIALDAFQGDGSIEDLEDQEKDRKANLVNVDDLGDGRKSVS
jgi:hypothetical protein